MFKVIDLFAGAGGFSRGFKEAGFKIIGAIENMPPVAMSYQVNFPEAYVIIEDIKKVNPSDAIDLIGEEPDVIIGGPPCEPFTSTNPNRMPNPLDRLYLDPIGQLVLYFIEFVRALKPKVFIMENVPGIIDGELKYALEKEFKRAGYNKIYFNLLYAEDYGTPSHRLRVFISNIKLKPKRKVKRYIPVIEALKGLPEPDEPHNIPNHEPIPLSPKKLKKISKLKWNQALIHYQGSEGKIYTNFIRLHPYKLAPTVMGSSRFIHPFKNRILTVRENARLMGFPDNHIFCGGRDLQFNQVGEAVPPPLAKAIAEEVLRYLKQE